MYNYKKKLKTQKYKNFQQIKLNYTYLLFCRYLDLNSQEFIQLKTFLNSKQIKFKIIKQNLLNNNYGVKGQGSLFVIYFHTFTDLEVLTTFFKINLKVEPLFLSSNETITSILKLNQILNTNTIPLPYQLKHGLLTIYRTLLRIT